MIATVHRADGDIEEYEVDSRTTTLNCHHEGYWHFKLVGGRKKTVAISEDEVIRVEIGEVPVPDDASALERKGEDHTV